MEEVVWKEARLMTGNAGEFIGRIYYLDEGLSQHSHPCRCKPCALVYSR